LITGCHTIVYAQDPDKARAFFKDVLEFPYVDAHEGWLIFKLPPSELGIHPTDASPVHEIFLMCDELDSTIADLRSKGVAFTSEIEVASFGSMIHFHVPGAGDMGLYEPRHPVAYNL
jgi:catechol 2,3-dioxygenase-like lactoylglutathione lyase family enzyme